MNKKVKPFVDTLGKVIRAHIDEHGLILWHCELLIVHDERSNRIVVTFAVVEPWEDEPSTKLTTNEN